MQFFFHKNLPLQHGYIINFDSIHLIVGSIWKLFRAVPGLAQLCLSLLRSVLQRLNLTNCISQPPDWADFSCIYPTEGILAIDWRMTEKEKLGYFFFSLPASGSISGSYIFSVAPAPIWKQVKKHSPYLRNEELCSTSLREQYLYTLFGILLYGRFTSSLSFNF